MLPTLGKVLFFASVIFFPPLDGRAIVFLNDSNVVEVDPSVENEPPVIYVGGGISPIYQNNSSTPTANDDDEDSIDDTLIVFDSPAVDVPATPSVVTSVVVTSTNANDGAGAGAGAGAGETTVDAASILNALIGNQALVTSTDFESGSGSFFGGGVVERGLYLYADRIRDAFRTQGITQFNIPHSADLLRDTRISFSQSDFALFVASATLKDSYLGDVALLNGKVEVKYRALGRLFGFIPLRYPLVASISFSQGSVSEVDLKFPWYSFVLSKGISPTTLSERIRSSVMTETSGFTTDTDIATRAFVATADTLREQFGDL